MVSIWSYVRYYVAEVIASTVFFVIITGNWRFLISTLVMKKNDMINRSVYFTLFVFFIAGCRLDTTPASATAVAQVTPSLAATLTALPSYTAPASLTAAAPAETAQATETSTAVNTATAAPPTPLSHIEVPGATVPAGFSIIKYADMYRPTSLTFDVNGRLFATSFDGTVHMFTDTNGDGRADLDSIFASGFNTPLGVAARTQPREILIFSTGKITVLRDVDGNGVADSRTDLVTGLPHGLHQNNNLKFGPDGWLYNGGWLYL